MNFKTLITLAVVVLALVAYQFRGKPVDLPRERHSLKLDELLAGAADGFDRVTAPREFVFPADHAAHPSYRTEWWYFTGHLVSSTGRRFGFQLTFFRWAFKPPGPQPATTQVKSNWVANNVYMAHFAVTDVESETFHSDERLARAAAGLAGVTHPPFRLWTDDWSVTSSSAELFPLQLNASTPEAALSLRLSAGKARVDQGDEGFSRKSAATGNASYYYSYTRLPAAGELRLGDEVLDVGGAVWMDREWSTSSLGPEQVGWDWFAVQLDDGRDIMFYRLRRRDGSVDVHSAGVVVEADGSTRRLSSSDVIATPLAFWSNEEASARYPIRWRLTVVPLDLNLEVEALLDDQEHALSVRYWEGAARVSGVESEKQVVSGLAYVEMTGYAD